jgi:hypothetical protein
LISVGLLLASLSNAAVLAKRLITGEGKAEGSTVEKLGEGEVVLGSDNAQSAPQALRLKGCRVAIVIANGYHEHEFWFPYYRFRVRFVIQDQK